jgi:hypothetical protein
MYKLKHNMIQLIKNLIFELSCILGFTSKLEPLQMTRVIEKFDVVEKPSVSKGRHHLLH